MPSQTYVSEIEIDAPPSAVWEVLADLDAYPRWNPFTIEVRSAFVVGASVDMRVRMLKLGMTVSQRETLRALEPGARIVWGADMMGGAIRAERIQTLVAIEAERTRYRTEDTIEGPLAPLVYRFFGSSVQAGFDALVIALEGEVSRRRS